MEAQGMMRWAVVAAVLAWSGVAAAQDAAAGERSFAGKCKACHMIGETAKNGVGPVMNGLFGRKAGTVPGYSYSAANKAADWTWDDASFADYIHDPKAKVPGTKMMFAGVRADKEVLDLAAYLKQFDAAGKRSP